MENKSKNNPLEIKGDFVSLAENLKSFFSKELKENIIIDKDNMLLEYDSNFEKEYSFPSIKIVESNNKLVESKFKQIESRLKENYQFTNYDLNIDEDKSNNIKYISHHYNLKENKNVILSINMIKDNTRYDKIIESINISLVFSNPVITETTHLGITKTNILEEDLLMESVFKRNKYNNELENMDRIMRINSISTVNLLNVFDSKLVSMLERRFGTSLNGNKEYYTTYKKSYEKDLLLRHFVGEYNKLVNNKALPKHISFAFSGLLYKGQMYPLLISINNNINRVIGVYCFLLSPDTENEGVYQIGKAELYHSPVDSLASDILKVRKVLKCSYFG
ncbi:hypothetical protein PBI_PBS1_273 [Bacillus phage PBS1]|uniref:Uncharacterized protein n=1 Tax=Bacillus phage PBS1 TaxID=2884423 RepID=A0A223LDI1_BPPB1|nr:hypothetical protein FK780_gp174 [Bacillus phage PBS1]ASU00095.1 hypothetical protein PBI_PBS1_273 [Bacillus phage PBS1]WCS68203.1 hypothetical protein Goe21_00930 [Bacillus phage vB_BsuM-Goe21]BDE75396.1 hypothetical protein [Bacillus phage PBS1]